MPELLPVPLNIHRHNLALTTMDHDYHSLMDYTNLVTDMQVREQEEIYQ